MSKLVWVRVCQECGHKQITTEPSRTDKKQRWRDTKCKKCDSAGSLDYGCLREVEDAKCLN